MSDSGPVPAVVHAERLLLRPWRAEDAPALHTVLAANQAHLGAWIPPRVAELAPVSELAARLDGFAQAFEANREWRYGVFDAGDDELLGEVSLFPRAAAGRVPYAEADHIEIGYWLRADRTGRGLATEAARAALGVAAALPGLTHVEIRCDARNAASAAIPRRLDFELTTTVEAESLRSDEAPVELQVWTLRLAR